MLGNNAKILHWAIKIFVFDGSKVFEDIQLQLDIFVLEFLSSQSWNCFQFKALISKIAQQQFCICVLTNSKKITRKNKTLGIAR